ncbi:MAG: SDR family NAD(P)-dependent oxidoreductase [Hyphomonadaceae bacterium]|nr:SDR family NAD(P)-dependent oxidoreductase [Hyphomonadaceae bacterium]
MTNKTVGGTYLITGATSGMGLKIARRLAASGADHIITGIRSSKTAAALRGAIPTQKLTLLDLDLMLLKSTRDFATAVQQLLSTRGESLNGIICNAGLQMIGPKSMTADGVEATFAVNYLSHFLLVNALLPSLVAGGKVVTIGSGTHNPDDPVAKAGNFRGAVFPSAAAVAQGDLGVAGSEVELGQDRYATSKLCCILFARRMAELYPPEKVSFYSFDPGLMPGTNLARERPAVVRFIFKNVLPMVVPFIKSISSPSKSARMVVDGILARDSKYTSGDYVEFTGHLAPHSPLAVDDEHAEDLLTLSKELIAPFEVQQ